VMGREKGRQRNAYPPDLTPGSYRARGRLCKDHWLASCVFMRRICHPKLALEPGKVHLPMPWLSPPLDGRDF
jgi:hypothetical protein